MDTDVKEKDAYRVACSIVAKADFLITTDDRLLKCQTTEVAIATPGEFIRRLEVSLVIAPGIPLKAYEDSKAFKLFLADVGLLSCMVSLRLSVFSNAENGVTSAVTPFSMYT